MNRMFLDVSTAGRSGEGKRCHADAPIPAQGGMLWAN